MAGRPSYTTVAVLGVIMGGGSTGRGERYQMKTEGGMARVPLKMMPLLKRSGYEGGRLDSANIVATLVCRGSLVAPTAVNP